MKDANLRRKLTMSSWLLSKSLSRHNKKSWKNSSFNKPSVLLTWRQRCRRLKPKKGKLRKNVKEKEALWRKNLSRLPMRPLVTFSTQLWFRSLQTNPILWYLRHPASLPGRTDLFVPDLKDLNKFLSDIFPDLKDPDLKDPISEPEPLEPDGKCPDNQDPKPDGKCPDHRKWLDHRKCSDHRRCSDKWDLQEPGLQEPELDFLRSRKRTQEETIECQVQWCSFDI